MQPATLGAFFFAMCLAAVVNLILTRMSLPLAFGVSCGLIALIVAIVSNRLALYLMILAMLLTPDATVGELGTGTTLGRGLTFRVEDALIVIISLTWLAKTAIYRELGLVFKTPLNRPMVAYSVAAIFATGLGIIAGQVKLLAGALFVFKYIQYFVIYFMVVNNLQDRTDFERFLLVLLITAAIACLIGIRQIPSGERVSSPFETRGREPNTFGGYLVLMLALVGGLYLTSESLRQKGILACLAALILLPLFFTLSRASYLALIPMAIALFCWSERKRFLAFLFAMSLLILPLLVPQAVVGRIRYTIAQPRATGQLEVAGIRLDTSTSERVTSWQQAVLRDWPKRPIFGWGVTGYIFLDAQYPRVLAETGLVGFAAFLWLQITLYRRLVAIYRQSQDPLFRGVSLGVAVGYIGLIVHSLGANTFIIVRIMEPFWFLVGMVMMIPALERVTPAAPGLTSERGSAGPWRGARQ